MSDKHQDDLFATGDTSAKQSRGVIPIDSKKANAVAKVAAIAKNYNKEAVTEWLSPDSMKDRAGSLTHEMAAYGYMPSVLLTCMPHKEMGTYHEGYNGRKKICIQSFPDIGLPYGRYPRLIMPFLAKHAKMQIDHKKAAADPNYRLEINLGKNFDEFLRAINIKGSGGETMRRARVSDQFHRLLSCQFRIQIEDEDMQRGAFKQMHIASEGCYNLVKNKNGHMVPDWRDGSIVLSREFYNEIRNHSLPVRLTVLFQLESSLQIDIYTWLEYRINYIDKPMYLSWANVKQQFGGKYADTPQGMAHFKSKFKDALNKVISISTTDLHCPMVHIKGQQIIIFPLQKRLSVVDNG